MNAKNRANARKSIQQVFCDVLFSRRRRFETGVYTQLRLKGALTPRESTHVLSFTMAEERERETNYCCVVYTAFCGLYEFSRCETEKEKEENSYGKSVQLREKREREKKEGFSRLSRARVL